jgi:hypothetical protein
MRKLNLPTEVLALGLTVVGAVFGGGIAYGALQRQQTEQDLRIAAVEDAPLKVAKIEATQARIEADIKEIKADQRVILEAVIK